MYSPSTWKMEVAASTETFAPSYHTTEGSSLLHVLQSSLALTSDQLFHLLFMVVRTIATNTQETVMGRVK